MSRFEMALMRLSTALRRAGAVKGREYAIFGSTVLVLRGIIDREPGDIDVFVSKRVWGNILPEHGWVVETPNAGDPPILSNKGRVSSAKQVYDDIHLNLFYDWRDEMVEIKVPELLHAAEALVTEQYGLWLVAPVEEVLRHKEAALSYGSEAVQKHRPDIEAINRYLGRSPA